MPDTATLPATAVTWFEIPAADLTRAKRFYETILDVPLRAENFAGSDIAIFPSHESGVKGCLLTTISSGTSTMHACTR